MVSTWKTLDERRKKIRQRVMKEIPAGVEISDRELDILIGKHIEQAAGEEYIRLEEKRRLRHVVFNSIRKMDVLQDILEDEEVTEIMVNGPDHIFVEKSGTWKSKNRRWVGTRRAQNRRRVGTRRPQTFPRPAPFQGRTGGFPQTRSGTWQYQGGG